MLGRVKCITDKVWQAHGACYPAPVAPRKDVGGKTSARVGFALPSLATRLGQPREKRAVSLPLFQSCALVALRSPNASPLIVHDDAQQPPSPSSPWPLLQDGYAIYFSRGMIPHNKKGEVAPFPAPYQDKPYLLHLGLQCYDTDFLKAYAKMESTPLQLAEDLEQLKVLENGYKIKVQLMTFCKISLLLERLTKTTVPSRPSSLSTTRTAWTSHPTWRLLKPS